MPKLSMLWVLALVVCLAPFAFAEDDPAPQPPIPTEEAETETSEEAPAPEPMPERMEDVMLWVVEGKPRVFLFGTIHLPDARLMKWPPVLEEAFAQSDAVRTELKMDAASQMNLQKEMMSIGLLEDGKKLDEVVGAEAWRRIEKRLGMTAMVAKNLKPWLVYMMLIAGEVQKQYAEDGDGAPHKAEAALDVLLYNKAEGRSLDVGGLETALEQMNVFTRLTLEEQVTLLKDALDDLDKGDEVDTSGGEDMLEVLLRHYLKGEAEPMMRLMEAEYSNETAIGKKLAKGLLTDRNVRMTDRILTFTKEHPEKTLFVAVGTAHMPGKDGIVKLLEQRGHRVTRLHVGDLAKIARPSTALPQNPFEEEAEEADPVAPKREPAGAGK